MAHGKTDRAFYLYNGIGNCIDGRTLTCIEVHTIFSMRGEAVVIVSSSFHYPVLSYPILPFPLPIYLSYRCGTGRRLSSSRNVGLSVECDAYRLDVTGLDDDDND